jgi:hypothetical protein
MSPWDALEYMRCVSSEKRRKRGVFYGGAIIIIMARMAVFN